MRALIIVAAGLSALLVTPAFAHEGGHTGGCDEFGHTNYEWAHNSETVAAGIEEALGVDLDDPHNLGGIVSWFAQRPDSWPGENPGVGDIVELSDHAACG